MSGIFMLTPNEDELYSLCKFEQPNIDSAIDELLKLGVKKIWLRKGAEGSEIFTEENKFSLSAPNIQITDSTGAGDAALAGWAAARWLGMNEAHCQQWGHALALEVLQVAGALAIHITKEKLLIAVKKYYPDET